MITFFNRRSFHVLLSRQQMMDRKKDYQLSVLLSLNTQNERKYQKKATFFLGFFSSSDGPDLPRQHCRSGRNEFLVLRFRSLVVVRPRSLAMADSSDLVCRSPALTWPAKGGVPLRAKIRTQYVACSSYIASSEVVRGYDAPRIGISSRSVSFERQSRVRAVRHVLGGHLLQEVSVNLLKAGEGEAVVVHFVTGRGVSTSVLKIISDTSGAKKKEIKLTVKWEISSPMEQRRMGALTSFGFGW